MKIIKPTKEGDNVTRIILETEEEKTNFLANWKKLEDRKKARHEYIMNKLKENKSLKNMGSTGIDGNV